jgi:hypothetical protein
MQCPTIKKNVLLFGIGFFFEYRKYFASNTKKMKKKHIFLVNFQPKLFNFQMALNSINVYQ